MNIQKLMDGCGSVLSILVPILTVMAIIYIGLCLINQRNDRRW
ncbi:hypothetical protein [Parabacteroides goldsteinii]|nr:hypothetical protein [Parabacteroides goldsteinii]